MGVTGIDRIR